MVLEQVPKKVFKYGTPNPGAVFELRLGSGMDSRAQGCWDPKGKGKNPKFNLGVPLKGSLKGFLEGIYKGSI